METAEAALGCRLSAGWEEQRAVFELRLGQLDNDPALEPWLTRAIELTAGRRMVGVAGFHGPPGFGLDAGSQDLEFGYTVFEGFRRRGIATEASEGLMRWAVESHRRGDFILSIAPTNIASQRTAARLGFERVGEYVHPERAQSNPEFDRSALAEAPGR